MLDRLLEEPGLPRNSMVVYDVLSSAQFDFQKIASSDRGSVAVRLKYVPDVVAGTGGLKEGKHQVLAYIRAALGEQLGFHALNDVALGMLRTGDGHEELRRGERGYVPAEKAHTSKKRERFLRQLAKHEKKLRRWNMIALEGKPLPSVIKVSFIHATRAGLDRQLEIPQTGAGVYRAPVASLPPGHWHVHIETSDWRLIDQIVR